ncbi:MAG: hypothetical protein Q9165_007517 [Trypethelium subeluteriae]
MAHIVQILGLSAATEAGLTIYDISPHKQPIALSYRQLQALALQKAKALRRHNNDVKEGQIVLVHFRSYWENIVWFWAVVLAGCIPAMSTPLHHQREGRISHFSHVYRMLLDPIVLTNQELADSDFGDNDVLRILVVEAIEDCAVVKQGSQQHSLHAARDELYQDATHRTIQLQDTPRVHLQKPNGADNPNSENGTDQLSSISARSSVRKAVDAPPIEISHAAFRSDQNIAL